MRLDASWTRSLSIDWSRFVLKLEPKGVMETAIQEKCPLFGAIIKTPMEAVRFILSILDVHPATASRVESQLETYNT